jgi:hypothetical protein
MAKIVDILDMLISSTVFFHYRHASGFVFSLPDLRFRSSFLIEHKPVFLSVSAPFPPDIVCEIQSL